MIVLVIFEAVFNYFIVRKIPLTPIQKMENDISKYGCILICLLLIFLNPGIIDKFYYEREINKKCEDQKKYKYCNYCKIYLPRSLKSTHCNFCGVCIEGYNHHNCIFGICMGKNNKYFFFFLALGFPLIYIVHNQTHSLSCHTMSKTISLPMSSSRNYSFPSMCLLEHIIRNTNDLKYKSSFLSHHR